MEHITAKCSKGINFLRSIVKTRWGADVKVALLFYKAYIRSIIDYDSILYGSALISILKRIDRIQYKCLRLCIGAMKSTPIQALLAESSEPPLHIRREALAFKFLTKHKFINTPLLADICQLNVYDLSYKYWSLKPSPPLCGAFRDYVSRIENVRPFTFRDVEFYSLFVNIPIIIPSYSNIPAVTVKIHIEYIRRLNDYVALYTDASKTNEGCGASYFIPKYHYSRTYKLNSGFTIYSCEAIALYEALKFARDQSYKICYSLRLAIRSKRLKIAAYLVL